MLKFDQSSMNFLSESDMPITFADPALPDCPLVFVNKKFEQLTGYNNKEVIGSNCRFLQFSETSNQQKKKIRIAIQKIQTHFTCILNVTKFGEKFINVLYISPIKFEGNVLIMGCQHKFKEEGHFESLKFHANNLGSNLEKASILSSLNWSTVISTLETRSFAAVKLFQSELILSNSRKRMHDASEPFGDPKKEDAHR
jgi:PAS domain S-box-containing protein